MRKLAAGLFVVLGVSLLSCASDDRTALRTALDEVASVAPPTGAVEGQRGVNGCERDDWAEDSEPYGEAGYQMEGQDYGDLDAWYLPRWRELGWRDVPGQPGVVERTVSGEVVQAQVTELGRQGDRLVYTIMVTYTTGRC